MGNDKSNVRGDVKGSIIVSLVERLRDASDSLCIHLGLMLLSTSCTRNASPCGSNLGCGKNKVLYSDHIGSE